MILPDHTLSLPITGYVKTSVIAGILTPLGFDLVEGGGQFFTGGFTYLDIILPIVSIILTCFTLVAFFTFFQVIQFVTGWFIWNCFNGYVLAAVTFKVAIVLLSYMEPLRDPLLIISGQSDGIPAKVLGKYSKEPYTDERMILHAVSFLFWLMTVTLLWILELKTKSHLRTDH